MNSFTSGYILNPVVAKAQRAGESFCSRPCEFHPNQAQIRRLGLGRYVVPRLIFTNEKSGARASGGVGVISENAGGR